jgi:geranylgeranyl diphosphate synthase, type II
MEFTTFINEMKQKIDETSLAFINHLNLASSLKEAILYSYQAGGKRLRPLLLLSVLDAFQVDVNKGLKTATSLELVHTSSLIHDDLPCMDDDDYRRGKLTNHKVFGEASAVLAGDALLVNAYELIASDAALSDSQKVGLLMELAKCSGANGMIGGQELDIKNEGKSISLEQLIQIHEHKTGKLLEFALVAGGMIAHARDEELTLLRQSAYHIGLAFQIKDDILDVEGDEVLIGKKVNSDEKNNKSTYVHLLGLQEAKNTLQYHYDEALSRIHCLNKNTLIIEKLYQLIIERNY